MRFGRKFSVFIENLRRKRRLSLRKQHNDTEIWYMHVSQIELLGGLLAVVLVLFILILSLVAYTPILNLIPGYSGNKMRREMVENIVRIDSIESRLNELQAYYSNVSLIMDGKTPVNHDERLAADSVRSGDRQAVLPSAADSALRRQMEGDGPYSLRRSVTAAQGVARANLITPVNGVIASHFDPREGRYGVGVATAASQQILAVAEGTVVLTAWTPETGQIIQLQHSGDLISVYKHGARSLRNVGERVTAGEVIGYTAEGLSGEGGKGLFEFELWYSGVAVDPENYIVF